VNVATLTREQSSAAKLLQLMSAREETADASDRRGRSTGEHVVLSVRGAVLEEGHEPIDVAVRAGEIVGVAGLEGHGQERFIRTLAGVEAPVAGDVVRHDDGREIPLHSQAHAAQLGVAYVPRDRRTEGVFEPLSILDNFSLPTIDRDTVGVLVSDRRRRRRLARFRETLSMKYGSPRERITSLSGGNQQKVILARWLATGPRVLVLNDPTRGVDVGTKRDIYRRLDELARGGVAVVVLSTEVEEHMLLMDRVLVFREGRVFAEIPADELTREGLVGAFFGRREAARSPGP
jgi:ABC-type sugar transport system ATPase subunit